MMAVSLTSDEIHLLKQLKAAGARGRTLSEAAQREVLMRLTKARYVTVQASSAEALRYVITLRGLNALDGSAS